jgi:N-acetylglutamate synthase/N-acetylornithine aminotransferase
MADKLVTIATFREYAEAELARQMLEEFNIRAVVTGSNALNMFGGMPGIEGAQLQVLESQAKQAMEILNSQNPQEPNVD